jgi:hypothetical protein
VVLRRKLRLRQLVLLEKFPEQIIGIDGGGRNIGAGATWQSAGPAMATIVGEVKMNAAVVAAAQPFGKAVAAISKAELVGVGATVFARPYGKYRIKLWH